VPSVSGPVFKGAAGHGTDRFRKGADGVWRMTRRTIDQMYVDAAFLPSEEQRRRYVLTAARAARNGRPWARGVDDKSPSR